jgi:hypothetical protein
MIAFRLPHAVGPGKPANFSGIFLPRSGLAIAMDDITHAGFMPPWRPGIFALGTAACWEGVDAVARASEKRLELATATRAVR